MNRKEQDLLLAKLNAAQQEIIDLKTKLRMGEKLPPRRAIVSLGECEIAPGGQGELRAQPVLPCRPERLFVTTHVSRDAIKLELFKPIDLFQKEVEQEMASLAHEYNRSPIRRSLLDRIKGDPLQRLLPKRTFVEIAERIKARIERDRSWNGFVAPGEVEITDFRIGRNSQLLSATPVPVSVFAKAISDLPSENEPMLGHDVCHVGRLISVSARNRSGVPVRIKIEMLVTVLEIITRAAPNV